ncbi:unnamed protein product [Meganyctiphanes norvegica]|uniref:Uncharacterized protein n=1 Tax=Meganyctiphanes norvegica TaxID=48144 RepID=A0AAV2PNY6_MEGNR
MGAGPSQPFVIQHVLSDKFVHVLSNGKDNNFPLVFNIGVHRKMVFEFEPSEDDDEYGFIKHVATGRYIHPYGGSEESEDNTPLVLYEDKHPGCLFNVDQETGLIKHRGGRYFAPALGHSHPVSYLGLVLLSDPEERSQFRFADPENIGAEIQVACDSDSGEE